MERRTAKKERIGINGSYVDNQKQPSLDVGSVVESGFDRNHRYENLILEGRQQFAIGEALSTCWRPSVIACQGPVSELPYFPFYPKDFLSDRKVATMTNAACGVYIRLLCYAWNEEPRGSVPKSLISNLGVSLSQDERNSVESCFFEQGDRLFQKRMVEEAAKLAAKKQAQSEGGRRAMTKFHKLRRSSKSVVSNLQVSTNKSESESDNNPLPPKGDSLFHETSDPEIPETLKTTSFLKSWKEWDQHRRKGSKRKDWTPQARKIQLKKCEEWGPEKSVLAIENSMQSSWQGLFEPKEIKGSNGHGQAKTNRNGSCL